MRTRMKKTLVVALVGSSWLALVGCGPKQVKPIKNVERAVTMWSADRSATGQAHLCLEYSTAAEKLHDREANASIPIGDKSVTLGYKDAESLANIYSVSEIMQFGHAALYRLCEASGNQAIDEKTYEELFTQAIGGVRGLIELQLLREKLNSVDYLNVLRSELDRIDQRRCGLARSASTAASREILSLNGHRRDLEKRIKELGATLHMERTIGDLPTEATVSQKEYEALDIALKLVLDTKSAVSGDNLEQKQRHARAELAKATGTDAKVTAWDAACRDLQIKLETNRDGACVGDFVVALGECP